MELPRDEQHERVDEAIAVLENANANLEPELMSVGEARALLASYSRVAKLAAFGVAALSSRLDDATELARVTGTSVGRAKATVDTGKALRDADQVTRQRAARSAHSHNDELGMVHIWLTLQPHVGTPIVNRADAEAARIHREARKNGASEPFERHRADAYAALLAGSPTGARSRRPDWWCW